MIATGLRVSLSSVFAVAIAVSVGAGCGGGKGTQKYPDAAGVPGTGGGATTGTGGAGGGNVGTGGGNLGTGGSAPDAGGTDAPPAAGSIRVLGGLAALVSPGPSCSVVQATAGSPTPDQWCGVIRPGTAAGTISLSVVNVTQAIAGATVTCAAGDPNCLLLSTNLSTAMDAASGFFGETLVYYEAASVLAWKPGWTAGRVLVPHDQLASCAAGPATAICIKATADVNILNLYAGRIDTQAGAALALIEPIDSNIAQITFSVDLMSVLWSTRTSATAPETLKMQTIGDAATRRTVATNVTSWNQTPDGARWLWLSQPTTDPVAMITTGTLQTAPFPSGAAPTNVHTAVIQYAPWSGNSLMLLATPGALGADLKAIANVDNPAGTATVIEAGTVVGFSDLTGSGTVLYSTDFVVPDPVNNPNTALINLLTSNATGTSKCVATMTPTADSGSYLPRSSLAVGWVRAAASGVSGLFDGFFTTLSGCTTAPFSTVLSGYQDALGGIVLLENYNPTAFTTALGLAPYAANGTLGAKVVIHPAANPTVMPLFPTVPRVVYSLNQTALEGGIYISAPLAGVVQPFGGVSTDAASAGVADATWRARFGKPATTTGTPAALAALPRALRTSLLPSLLPKSWNPRSPIMVPRRLAATAGATATKARPSPARSAR